MSRCESCFDCAWWRVLLHPRHCEPTDGVGNEPEEVVHRLALDSCAIGGTEEVRLGSSRVARRVSWVWFVGFRDRGDVLAGVMLR